MSDFVHLHVHSDYSLLDGACRHDGLIALAKEYGMPAVAVTDHGNLFGAMEFYKKAEKAGIKPILGCEVYTVPGDDEDSHTRRAGGAGDYNHLLLLCETYEGWKNLQRLCSEAYRTGFYYKPRVSHHLLRKYSRGLIATSACLKGEVCQAVLRGDIDRAAADLSRLRDIFGEKNLYVELQANGVADQRRVNPGLAEVARKLSLPLVGTGDVHYLRPDDRVVQDALVCVNTGKLMSDKDRLKFNADLHFRSGAEMATAWSEWGLPAEALAATAEIACRCSVDLRKEQFGKVRLPRYAPRSTGPAEVKFDSSTFFRSLVDDGLRRRYGHPLPEVVEARHQAELAVIEKLGFVDYLLVVWDFIDWAKKQGIPVGPGRGSAAGSILCYAIGITDVDPIAYDLLFERFLNKDRVSLPDIDVDFCQERRGEVIEYVRDRYRIRSGPDGTPLLKPHEAVAQICTFGTMAGRSVLRDVGRVLGVPRGDVDGAAKLVPADLQAKHKKLKDAFVEVPELAAMRADSRYAEMFRIAERLEGSARSVGTHAAGLVIADCPVEERVPLYRDPRGTDPSAVSTQFGMTLLEDECGLVKMDILGLKTLTVIDWCLRMVNEEMSAAGYPPLSVDADVEPVRGALLDPERPDAALLYDLLRRGDTLGVFQFESSGYRDLLVKLKPDDFEDIIALGAMYRPGPLGAGMVDAYVERKHGRESVTYPHPLLEQVLGKTYGCMLYQEQVMRITSALAGFTLSQADSVRKAMGKKKPEEMAKWREKFLAGCAMAVPPCSPETAKRIWEQMEYFAGYGFNKCVAGSTIVFDAETGGRSTVADLFESQRPFSIHALGDDGKLRSRRVTKIVRNGRKPVFELRTMLGKRIVATGNHPFRTLDGWTNLEGLRVGDRVAVPRHTAMSTTRSWPKHELIVLAGLLTEGNTCHPSSLYFCNNNQVIIDDFVTAANLFPDSVARVYKRPNRELLEVCVNTGINRRFPNTSAPGPRRSGMYAWASGLGIVGKKATAKVVPPVIFELCHDDVALFVGRLWSGDGFISNHADVVPFYATSSPALARDVQALLLRLGIQGRIHNKMFKYRGTERPGYTVSLIGEGSRETFLKVVAPHCVGLEPAVERLRLDIETTERDRTSKDTIPTGVRRWVDDERRAHSLTWKDLEAESNVSMKEFYGAGSAKKQGFRRKTILNLAKFFGSQKLHELATSDIFWDRVISIEAAGTEETFDLTVDVDHNFVADGLIVHNSHSAAYGLITFQTAWLKANYPEEFMAALISSEVADVEKVAEYVTEARRAGIAVLPPDVQESGLRFSVVRSGPKFIRYGLSAIRGLGDRAGAALEALGAARLRQPGGRFASLYDLCAEADLKRITPSVLELLNRAGALSSFGSRAQVAAEIPVAVEYGRRAQADRSRGQASLFGGPGIATPVRLPAGAAEWSLREVLAAELACLGCYLSGHPVDEYRAVAGRRATPGVSSANLGEHAGREVTVACSVSSVRQRADRRGETMAFLTVGDQVGSIDAVVFSRVYGDARGDLSPGSVVFLRGKVDASRERPSIVVSQVVPAARADEVLGSEVRVALPAGRPVEATMAALTEVLRRHPGKLAVVVEVVTSTGVRADVRLGDKVKVATSEKLSADLRVITS